MKWGDDGKAIDDTILKTEENQSEDEDEDLFDMEIQEYRVNLNSLGAPGGPIMTSQTRYI